MPPARSNGRLAVYPGSFDPITLGHLDVITRGRRLFDKLVIAVGRNPGKRALFSAEERVEMAETLVHRIVAEEPREAEIAVESFSALTVDFARRTGATAILKGIRNLSDLQYEIQQAVTNRQVANLETVFIVAGQSFAYTSSTLIKQIAAMGEDLSALKTMCPDLVIERLEQKKAAGDPFLRNIASPEGGEE
jgi:pantetheine-phosphate adenylyltransferase